MTMGDLRRRFSDRIIDAMPGYLTVQDSSFKIVEANESFREHFGNHEGRYCYQVYKRRSERCEDCPVDRTFRTGDGHSSEEIVTTLDGRQVHVLVNTTPIRDENGKVTQVIEMSTDITEQKLLQGKLRESRERYQQLFEEVPCYISIQDRDLRIVEANRMFHEAFGNHLGGKCYEVYKHRSEECRPCIVRDTFKTGESHLHEEVVTDKKGSRINVLVHTMPIYNADGEIDHVIEMSADITQIRQLQSELTSIGLLISSISHGLKGLLNNIDGGVYLVNSGLEKDNQERVTKGWEIAQRNIERIRSMVMDILYYAKSREPEVEELNAGELLDEVVNLIRGRAKQFNVEVAEDTSPRNSIIEGDYKAIRSMLVNLIENSLDACRVDKEKPSHRITTSLEDLGDSVKFMISDDGIGMDQETREKAFSLFFSSKGTEGTGLGLFVASKIAASHGGHITLESELKKGTTFTVVVPKRCEQEAS